MRKRKQKSQQEIIRENEDWLNDEERDYDFLQLINYDSNNLIKFSDHRPVFAEFILLLDENVIKK